MAPSNRDRISVDLRGLRAALFEQARARGVSPSDLLRRVVADAVGEKGGAQARRIESDAGLADQPQQGRVRLALRLPKQDADVLLGRAREAGLPIGAYVVALLRDGQQPPSAEDRRAATAALSRSNAELATITRDLSKLNGLLSRGESQAASAFRQSLATLSGDVRKHLVVAATLLKQQSTTASGAQPSNKGDRRV